MPGCSGSRVLELDLSSPSVSDPERLGIYT